MSIIKSILNNTDRVYFFFGHNITKCPTAELLSLDSNVKVSIQPSLSLIPGENMLNE